jgi:hypothetical protein
MLAAAAPLAARAQATEGSASQALPAQAPEKPSSAKPMPSVPATPAPAAQSAQWKSYSYAADGFSASFPSEPTLQKQSVPTDAGTFELHAFMAADGQVALYVGVCDYGSAASGQDPQPILDGAKNGAVSNANAHVVSTSKIMLGVYPGIAFEAESGTLHFSARFYLVGTMLYQVLTASPVGQPYVGTPKFLDSFQLIPRTTT